MSQPKRFLIRHLGNMGDLVFFVPPVLETLKKRYPDSHITFVTAWGYKHKIPWGQLGTEGTRVILDALARGAGILSNQPREAGRTTQGKKAAKMTPSSLLQRPTKWGGRNQGGFSIALMMTNPHIDQLIHWHDTKLDLAAATCCEDGRCFPTWNKEHYEQQKASGDWDGVYELDFGLTIDDNPIEKMYEALSLEGESFSQYRLYFTEEDVAVAAAVMMAKPRPRIMLLESLSAENTRGWDNDKVPALERMIEATYGVHPLWFGGSHIPQHEGRPITLRQNIATMMHADAAIGVMSGPLHFAAAAGVPTLTLYGDQPLHRAAPAYFLNDYISDPAKKHRTLLGPSPSPLTFLKSETAPAVLSLSERRQQGFRDWLRPGRQATKSCLAPITPDEIMAVLADILPIPNRVNVR